MEYSNGGSIPMEELVQLLSNTITVTGRGPTTVLRGGLIYGQRVKQFHTGYFRH